MVKPLIREINARNCIPLSSKRRKTFKNVILWIGIYPKAYVLKPRSPVYGAIGRRWKLQEVDLMGGS